MGWDDPSEWSSKHFQNEFGSRVNCKRFWSIQWKQKRESAISNRNVLQSINVKTSHCQRWPLADRQNAPEKVLAKDPLILLLARPWGNVRTWTSTDVTLKRGRFFTLKLRKKILNLLQVCLVKGNEQRGRSQPCVKGLLHKGGRLALMVTLSANFADWSCRKLLISLPLRKDLAIGIKNRRCRKFASWFFEKILRSKVLDKLLALI